MCFVSLKNDFTLSYSSKQEFLFRIIMLKRMTYPFIGSYVVVHKIPGEIGGAIIVVDCKVNKYDLQRQARSFSLKNKNNNYSLYIYKAIP